MTKIAINKCSGGFGLSDEAFEALLDRKGIEWEKVKTGFCYEHFLKARVLEDDAYLSPCSFCDNRTDPDLIAVIENLGREANGEHADLRIVDLPAGTKYYIHEYFGVERLVIEDPRTETA